VSHDLITGWGLSDTCGCAARCRKPKRQRNCSALRFSTIPRTSPRPRATEARPNPFQRIGPEELDDKQDFRLTSGEKQRLREEAALAGISVGALVRRRSFGRTVISQVDLTMIGELRRLGGLMKLLHNQSGGAYSGETFEALQQIKAAITRLATDPRGTDGSTP
jgi:hypothetical protein